MKLEIKPYQYYTSLIIGKIILTHTINFHFAGYFHYYKRYLSCLIIINQYRVNMDKIINQILSQSPKFPSLPKNLTEADVRSIEEAIRKSMNKKIQSTLLKILLAQAYKRTGNDKCSRQVSDISFQNVLKTEYQLPARFRICRLINDMFDESKIDVVKMHLNELTYKQEMNVPENKFHLYHIKAGFEALRGNYLKAAIGYFNCLKDEVIAKDIQQIISLMNKCIVLCFLTQKNQQLHQLLCQLYVYKDIKKSEFYPLLLKLYSEASIEPKQIQPLQKLLPLKFRARDSENISLINKSIFMHNMIPVMKFFNSISLQSLVEFIGLPLDQLLILIQKSYTNEELQIDQVEGYLYLKSNPLENQISIKKLFDDIDELIVSSEPKK